MFLRRVIVTICFSFFAIEASADAKSVATYAVLLPLTGNGSDQGQWCRNGLELAAEQLNSENRKIELVFDDTHGDSTAALNAFRYISARKKLSGVFTWGSGVAMALSAITNKAQIIQMGIATATPAYTSVGDYTFRVFPSASDEAMFFSQILSTKYPEARLASIYVQNDYGVGTLDALREQLRRSRKEFISMLAYNPGDTDFRSILLQLKQLNLDIIHLAAYPNDGALLLRQAREIGIKAEFMASVAIAGGINFFDLAGPAMDNLLVSSTEPNEKHVFYKLYNQKYGEGSIALQLYAARAFDALNLLELARQNCSGSSDCMRDYLFKIRNFEGASGKISFDEAGDSHFLFRLYKVKDKKLVAIQ